MAQIVVKAGSTFNFAGLVTELAPGQAWIAAARVVDATGADVATLTSSLVEASDYSTSGNWLLTISATGAETAEWATLAAPFGATTLYADVRFSISGDAEPVVYSDSFAILVVAGITPAGG